MAIYIIKLAGQGKKSNWGLGGATGVFVQFLLFPKLTTTVYFGNVLLTLVIKTVQLNF